MNDNDSETGPLSRALLKGFFKNNAIPSLKNFAALIDGMLIQEDDGIFKKAGEPLSLKADGDAKQPQTLLNFCESGQVSPAWKLQLIPVPGQPVPGFSISDGKGVSRLFIDHAGNIGVGTTTPKGKLDIEGVLTIGEDNNKPGIKSISFYRDAGDDKDAGKITYREGNPSSLDIIGAGKTTNDRTIKLVDHARVYGNLAVTKDATVAGGLRVTGNTTIQGRTGPVNPTGKLDIAGVLCIGLNGQKSISFARKDGSYSETVGTISYKQEGVDKARSFYGAESAAGSTSKVIKLYDNVEVSGGLKVKGRVIRKVTRNKDYMGQDKIGSFHFDTPIIVSTREMTFDKLHSETAIRIIYFDNIWAKSSGSGDKNSNIPEFKVCIKVDNNYKMDIFASYLMNCVTNRTLKVPITIFGYAKGITEGTGHKVQVYVIASFSNNGIYEISFGDTNGGWFIEVQEVMITT